MLDFLQGVFMKKFIILFCLGISTLFAFEELTLDNFEEKTAGKKVILDFYTVG